MLPFIQYFVVIGCVGWLFTLSVVDCIDWCSEKLENIKCKFS